VLGILRFFAVGLFLWFGSTLTLAADLQLALGDNLRLALDRYGEAGLNVISTTRLVPPRLSVTQLPDPDATLVEQVRALLAPHGLTLEIVDNGNAYVRRLSTNTDVPAPDTDSTVQDRLIEEMVVTSHYQVRRNPDVRTPLDHEDLMTMPSLGRDTLRGLDALPGVASSGLSARHQFRGGDENEILYRFDRIELLEPFHLKNEQSLFSAINVNVIDAADIYMAGFPVSMGARMSGVVDLLPTEPQVPFAGGVDLNLITSSVDARGVNGQWSWLGSARRSVLHHTLDQFETDYGEPRFHDEFLRVVHDNERRALVGGLLRSSDRIEVRDRSEQGAGRSQYEAAWLRAEYSHGPNLRSNWQLSSIVITNQRSGSVDEPLFSVGTLRERREFENVEIENDWSWRLNNRFDLQAGWSFAHQSADFRALSEVTYGGLALPIQGVTNAQQDIEIDRSGESMVAFAALVTRLTDKLTMEAGIRYDGQDIDPVHVNEISGRISVDYQLTPGFGLTLNAGRYTQQQHLYEIQIDDGKVELDPPQHSDQINLTAIWQTTENTRLRLGMYFRDVDNPWSHFDNLYNRWVLLPELQGDRYEIAPTGGRSSGLELSFNQQVNDQLSWHASYAYGKAQEYYLGEYRDRPWQQTHSYKAGFRWSSARWRFGLNATYRSGWPTTEFIAAANNLPFAIYDDRLPKYFSLDLHVSRMVALPRGSLEFYLDVMNVTDRENIGGYDYYRSSPHEQKLLPVVPTLGVMWRWGLP
jgi:hypothetical protein